MIFTVIFWTALWAVAAQADFLLTKALWGDGFLDNIANFTDPENATKSLVHSVVVLGLYIFLPTISTWMLAAAAVRGSTVVGGASRGSGVGQISNSGSSGFSASRTAASIGASGTSAMSKWNKQR